MVRRRDRSPLMVLGLSSSRSICRSVSSTTSGVTWRTCSLPSGPLSTYRFRRARSRCSRLGLQRFFSHHSHSSVSLVFDSDGSSSMPSRWRSALLSRSSASLWASVLVSARVTCFLKAPVQSLNRTYQVPFLRKTLAIVTISFYLLPATRKLHGLSLLTPDPALDRRFLEPERRAQPDAGQHPIRRGLIDPGLRDAEELRDPGHVAKCMLAGFWVRALRRRPRSNAGLAGHRQLGLMLQVH